MKYFHVITFEIIRGTDVQHFLRDKNLRDAERTVEQLFYKLKLSRALQRFTNYSFMSQIEFSFRTNHMKESQ